MGSDAAVLLTTDATALQATVVLRVLEEFPEKTASGNGLSVLTQASHLDGKLDVESASLDVILSLSETPGHHSAAWLAELSRALKPGGSLIIQEPVAKRELSPEEAQKLGSNAGVVQTESLLQRSLLLAGFVGTSTFRAMDGVGLSAGFSFASVPYAGSQVGPLFQPLALKAKKPSYETGTSFSLRKKTIIKHEGVAKSNGTNGKLSLADVNEFNINVSPAGNGVVSWKASVIGLENDELVDEDSLLTEEDLKGPEVSLVDDDCEVGNAGRKACKNCTCGRAEMEEDETKAQPETKLTLGQINNPQSACGSCGLGDAFRCGGCPYRGLPAFKLGEKIALPSSLLTADV